MSNLKFAIALSIDVTLTELSVSGRKGYSPKVWAFVDYDGQQGQTKVKFRVSKRAKKAVLALGNDSEVKAKIMIECANEERSFSKGKGEDKTKIDYYETVTEWTIVAVNEVINEGVMPKEKANGNGGEVSEDDTLPD